MTYIFSLKPEFSVSDWSQLPQVINIFIHTSFWFPFAPLSRRNLTFSAMRLLRISLFLKFPPLSLRIGDTRFYASLGVPNWTEGDALRGTLCLWVCTKTVPNSGTITLILTTSNSYASLVKPWNALLSE